MADAPCQAFRFVIWSHGTPAYREARWLELFGKGNRWHFLVLIFLVVALVLTVLQVWSAVSTQRIVLEAIEQAATKSETELGAEKTRQELIGQRIANDSRGNIQTNLAAGLGALSAVIIASPAPSSPSSDI